MYSLDSKVGEISKVGKALTVKLKRLGIETVRDLIFYYPFRYDDFSVVAKIAQLLPGANVTITGQIELIANKRTSRRRKMLTEALISDDTGSIKIIWFNQPWIGKSLKSGDRISVSGRVTGDMFNYYFNSPSYEKISAISPCYAGIIPIYSLTEGLTQKQLRFLIKSVKANIETIGDYLPLPIKTEQKFPSLSEALLEVHFPTSQQKVALARQRLAFDELFLIQLMSQIRKNELANEKAWAQQFHQTEIKNFVSSLPYSLTNDQKKSAWEIIKDLEKEIPMNRLLEGDVGSGKTLVAVIAMYNTALNGMQSAIMAPTEVLAAQHYQSIKSLLAPLGIKVGLITRTQKLFNNEKLKKDEFISKCSNGDVDIIIGTHALIQTDIQFNCLALVIVDEQHRFGVEQRKAFKQKGADTLGKIPHFLSLTATPIPRSLSLIIYGDLDLSIIQEMPKDRKKIITKVVPFDKRQAAYDFISDQIKGGRQVFVICPLIDPSDKLGVRSVTEEFTKLDKQVFPHLPVGLLHGRLKTEAKEQVLGDFVANKIKILVSTSVVEVGIDIPNASVMMIEGAERFGLSQLHQFRGRVGRSSHQSYCFLFTDSLDHSVSGRLDFLAQCHDGFVLANRDLELRGAGNVFGVEQSGFFSAFKVADPRDLGLVQRAQQAAVKLLSQGVKLDDFPELKRQLRNINLAGHRE